MNGKRSETVNEKELKMIEWKKGMNNELKNNWNQLKNGMKKKFKGEWKKNLKGNEKRMKMQWKVNNQSERAREEKREENVVLLKEIKQKKYIRARERRNALKAI